MIAATNPRALIDVASRRSVIGLTSGTGLVPCDTVLFFGYVGPSIDEWGANIALGELISLIVWCSWPRTYSVITYCVRHKPEVCAHLKRRN